ncbi:MAG TPA: molybdopterin molybdotransferase MoeA [Phycicoccus sp.]|nr:molybdopterin molybdotransferase MoeA [Phycicoccus sp.]
MRTVEDHRAALLALVAPLAPVTVATAQAGGLVSAAPVVARLDLPGFDNSAMDGYAVHAADLHGPLPVRLPVIADIPAGDPRALHVPRGSAARIMTGAPLPAEADAVVPVEDTDAGVSVVEIRARVAPGRHVRRRGEDVRAGEPVVATGTVLTPGALALVAAANVTSVRAHPRPRVALFSTGDELIPLGDEPAPGQIVDSNQLMLAELVRAAGAELAHAGHLPDDAEAVRALLADPPGAPDLVLTSGGVSMGAHDTVKEVLTATGTVEFVKVAMRPGMPQGAGTLGPRGIPVVTLPGNPVSSLVSFQVFVVPLLRRLAGRAGEPMLFEARAGARWASVGGKVEYTRVEVSGGVAVPSAGQGSHMLGALAGANALAIVPASVTQVHPGDRVLCMPLLGAEAPR